MTPTRLDDRQAREALRHAAADLDAAEQRGQAVEMALALAQLGRCYRGLAELPSAELCFARALRWAHCSSSVDLCVDLLCELAQTAAARAEGLDLEAPGRGRAARERARDHAFEAHVLAVRVADAGWEASVLLRVSEVLDRCGDHDDAAQLQARALRLQAGKLAAGAPDASLLPSLGRLADS
jgi:tetratricopeptide (TPR) repeat protein